jgi:hypothetical protein
MLLRIRMEKLSYKTPEGEESFNEGWINFFVSSSLWLYFLKWDQTSWQHAGDWGELPNLKGNTSDWGEPQGEPVTHRHCVPKGQSCDKSTHKTGRVRIGFRELLAIPILHMKIRYGSWMSDSNQKLEVRVCWSRIHLAFPKTCFFLRTNGRHSDILKPEAFILLWIDH